MTSGVLRGARPGAVAAAAAVGPVVAGALLGALFPPVAYRFGPWVLPALVLLGVLLVLTVYRPVWGIVVALLLVPLGNMGIGFGPPWSLGAAWAGLLFLMAVVRGPGGGGGAMAQDRVPLLAGAVVLMVAVTALGWGLASEIEGALPTTRTLVTGAALFWAMLVFVRRPADVRHVLIGLAAAAVVVAGYATVQYLSGEASAGFFTSSGALVDRVAAGFGQPNALAGFLLMIAPFLLVGALTARRRLPWLVVLAVTVFGIGITFSRGALVGLAIMPLVFVGVRRAVWALPVLVALVVFATPDLLRERFATLTESGSEVATRLDFWAAAAAIWQQQPFLGVGPGGFPAAYAEVRVPGKEFLPATVFQPPPHAHSLPLHLLAEQGLLGLLAFALVVALAVRLALVLRRREDRLLAALGAGALAWLAGILVHNAVDVTLYEATAIYFWGLLGLLAAANGIATRASRGSPAG